MAEEKLEQNLMQEEDMNEILKIRRQKLEDLRSLGRDPFLQVKYDKTHSSMEIKEHFEELEGKQVSIAGRIMSKRGMGKASFCDVQDRDGRIQVYVRIDALGAEEYEFFKKYDIGDIVGVKGEVFKTHKGEISVKASEVTLLSKNLQPLPEKWHGLTNTDLRYRQRYVDLIVNQKVKETFIIRSKVVRTIRKFLDERGFLEVETPLLNTIAGGANARPFITHHNTLDIDLYLRIAPELYLKRLIVGGLERIYEIGRCFRNEGISIKHNPEFTMLELYQAYTDYNGMMDLAEEMLTSVVQEVLGTLKFNYQGREIDMSRPWRRVSMTDLVKEYSGVDFNAVTSDEEARRIAEEKKVTLEGKLTKGEILNAFFEEFVEEKLIQPTFVIDYPIEISPLTKKKADNPALTERFELFIMGREMGNAYSELNDPIDQRERFLKQVQKREAGDDEANMMDEDFIQALEVGLPPTGGFGMGIDRFVMLLTDSYSIRDVLLFPTMKPKD